MFPAVERRNLCPLGKIRTGSSTRRALDIRSFWLVVVHVRLFTSGYPEDSICVLYRERERERERSGRQRSRSRENEAVRRRGREIQALTHRVDQTTPEHGSWRQPTSCPSTASLPIYLRTWTKLELLQHRPTKRRRTSSSVEHQRPVVDESNLNAPQAREICYHGLGVQMYLRLWSCWRGVYTMFKRVGMAEEEIFVGRNCLVVLLDAFVRTKRLEPRSLVSARTGGGLVPSSKNSLCQAFHVQNHYC